MEQDPLCRPAIRLHGHCKSVCVCVYIYIYVQQYTSEGKLQFIMDLLLVLEPVCVVATCSISLKH